jgi:hypothetical protein
MTATTDRGEILHAAGRARLSPALRDGAPALLPHGETAGRCGWAPFFAALEARRLAVAWDASDPSTVRLVPLAEAETAPGAPGARP